MPSTTASALDEIAEQLSLSLSSDQQGQIEDYLALLVKWNKVFNLTAVDAPEQMLSRHVADSLSIVPYLDGDSLLDVGTGAGLPGIMIAIVRPDIQVTLLDSNAKKTRFLQHVKAQLSLSNVTVVHGRIEQVTLPEFAMITARAFASIRQIIDLAGRHCDDAGSLLLMKGVYPHEELQTDLQPFTLRDVIPLKVPGSDAERHLVRLNR